MNALFVLRPAKLLAFNFGHPCPSLVKGEVLSPDKIRATTGGIATPSTLPRTNPPKTTLSHPLFVMPTSVCADMLSHPHHPSPRTKLASLVKGRWIGGKAQTLTLLHLLVICPPFLYCKLFCRQDGGIATPTAPFPFL